MALPPSAAAALASGMSKNGIGGGKPSPPDMPDEAPEKDEGAVHLDIAKDVISAIKSGSEEQAAKFLVELVERMGGAPESEPELPEEGAEEEEA